MESWKVLEECLKWIGYQSNDRESSFLFLNLSVCQNINVHLQSNFFEPRDILVDFISF